LVEKFGPAKALETLGADPEFSAITVHDWIEHHISHLTGLRKSTLYDYRSYLKNDIDEALGELPLQTLSRDDIARWMQHLSEPAERDGRPDPGQRRVGLAREPARHRISPRGAERERRGSRSRSTAFALFASRGQDFIGQFGISLGDGAGDELCADQLAE
jgi:hypothetical protein